MEGQRNYNEVSRKILSKVDSRLTLDLHEKIKQGKQIATVHEIHFADHELILLSFENIPTTMILSEAWPRELVTSKRSFGFIAASQSEGRGQHTNTWLSPPGNMYLTLLVEKEMTEGKYFPMLIANNTIRILKSYFEDQKKADELLRCKWVNDIFIGNLKVCGSLIKCSFENNKFYFEIGIGVNLNVSPIQGSTCLSAQIKKTIDTKEFTFEYARQAIKSIFDLTPASLKGISQEYQSNLLYLFQKVNIFKPDMITITHTGLFQGITEEGNAIILNQIGQRQIVTIGKMRPIFAE